MTDCDYDFILFVKEAFDVPSFELVALCVLAVASFETVDSFATAFIGLLSILLPSTWSYCLLGISNPLSLF